MGTVYESDDAYVETENLLVRRDTTPGPQGKGFLQVYISAKKDWYLSIFFFLSHTLEFRTQE